MEFITTRYPGHLLQIIAKAVKEAEGDIMLDDHKLTMLHIEKEARTKTKT